MSQALFNLRSDIEHHRRTPVLFYPQGMHEFFLGGNQAEAMNVYPDVVQTESSKGSLYHFAPALQINLQKHALSVNVALPVIKFVICLQRHVHTRILHIWHLLNSPSRDFVRHGACITRSEEPAYACRWALLYDPADFSLCQGTD